ncbi:uncharacterized protein [Oscarella lobularis]|uniref:uncharacterized protein isoform X2 n=1 Tax=Oscarella lobularis TaxID=121494 RepID=UPI0033138344
MRFLSFGAMMLLLLILMLLIVFYGPRLFFRTTAHQRQSAAAPPCQFCKKGEANMLGGSRRQQEAAYYNSKTYARHFQSFVQVLRSRLSEDDVADFMDAYDDYQSSRQLREFLNVVVPLLDTAQKRQSILVALHDVLPLADRTKYETIVTQYRLLPSSPAAAIVKAPLQSRPRSMPTPNGWATPPPSDVASSTQFSSATSPRRRPLSTATTNSNEKTTKLTLRRADGESFGFSVRGGAEHSLGVYVSSVDDGSVGQKAGLKAGMQIMKVNDVGFEGFTTSQAIRFFHETKKLRMHVVDRGRYPGTYVAQRRYNWVDQAGRPVSPPPQPRTVKTGDEEGRSDLRLLSNADEKRVNVVVREGQRLGISVRGGSEYGIGIFVSSVVDGSVADDAGLKAGDQIINVNGKTFLHVTNEEAIRILKAESLTMMMMTIKDIGKIPYSLVKYDQTKWVSTKDLPTQRDSVPYQSATMPTRGKKADRDLPLTRRPPSYYNSSSVQSGFSTFKPETSAVEEEEEESEEERPSLNKKRAGSAAFKHGMGTQLVLRTTQVHTARGQITDKARLVLTQQQFDTLAYYLDEYQANSISVEDMAEVLLQLFDTPKKIALLVEIRQIILPKDIDKFENLVMAREVESMNRARSESTNRLLKRGETFDTPPVRRRAADDELEEESNRTSVTVQVHRTSAEIAQESSDREDDRQASLSTHKTLVATLSDAPSVIEAVNAIAAAIEGADDDEDAEDDDKKRGKEEDEGRTEEDDEEEEEEEREEDRGGERQQLLSAVAQPSPPPVFRAPSPPPQDASDGSSSESDVEEEVVARAKKAEPSRPSPSLRFHVPPPPPPAPQQESDEEDIKEEKKEVLRLVPQISVSDESATPPIFRVPSPPPYDQEDSSSDDDDDDEEESSSTRTTPSSAKKPAPMAVSLPGLSVGGLDLVRSPSQHKMIHETLTERRRRIHPGSVRSRRSVSADSAATDVSVDDDTFDASYQDSPPVRRDEVGEPEQSSTPLRKDLAPTFEEEKRREKEERKKRLIEEEEERLAAEEERRKREAEERRQKEAEEKRKQEEAEERRKQEQAEEKRRQEEAEARRRREAEEKRKQEEAEEKRRHEEAEEKRRQEEAEEKRRQEEAEEKQRQEERKEAEEKKKQREAEERMRREREEQEQRRKEEEEKARIAAAAAAKGERGDDEVVDSLPPKQIRLRLKRGGSNRESMVFTEDAQRAEEAAAAVVQRRAAQEMAKGNDAARPEDLYAVPVKPKKLSGTTPPPPAEQPQSRTVAGYTGLTGAIVNILVPKSKPKLGMGVDGGESTKQKAVRVRLISAGGCASLVAPPLKLGQQILSIDNVSLKGKTHKQAVASIKEAFDSRRTEMTLTVHEDEEVEKMANAKRK